MHLQLALSSAFTAVAASSLLMPVPQSIYKVKWTNEEIIDQNRLDPFNGTHPRRMMLSRFTPVLAPLCTKTCRVPIWPQDIAALEDDIIEAFFPGAGWPKGLLATLELEVCCQAIDVPLIEYPKILFGTGLNTTRLSYSSTAQHLASRGYEVIVMDHPYETDLVKFPDGQIITGGHIIPDRNNTASLDYGLDVRSADAKFVMDKLCINKTVFIGQSYGGAAASDIVLKDSRVVGGVNLDGAMFGRSVPEGVPRPFLIFGSDGHNSTTEPTWGPFLDAMRDRRPGVWNREISLVHSGHGSFTDMSIIGDISGLRSNKELVEGNFGEVLGSHAMAVLKDYMDDFIRFTLEGRGPGLLEGPSWRHRDVEFLRGSHYGE